MTTDITNPKLPTKECKVPIHIHEEHLRCLEEEAKDKFYGQSHCVFFSTFNVEKIGMQFALFYCTARTALRIIIVYETEEERKAWVIAHKAMFGNFNLSARLFLVDDEETEENVLHYTNEMVTEDKDQRIAEHRERSSSINDVFVTCLIKRTSLYEMYPYQKETYRLLPFRSDESAISAMFSSLCIAHRDARAVSPMLTPIVRRSRRGGDNLNVYAHMWDYLIVCSNTVISDEHVHDLNLLSIRHRRVFLNSVVDDHDDITVANARRLLSCTDAPLPDQIRDVFSNKAEDRELIEEYALGEFVQYFRLNDVPRTDLQNTVTVKRSQKGARLSKQKASTSLHLSENDLPEIDAVDGVNFYTGISEFRSTIDFNTFDGSRNIVEINQRSNVSILLIYDEGMITKLKKIRRHTVSNTHHIITEEDNVRLKCTTIISYTMSHLDKSFYLVSPYISKGHPFYNLPNVRCLHPSDKKKILAVEPEYTIIVFDTLFVNQKRCVPYKQCKAHVVFAMFQHTTEEVELRKYMATKPLGSMDKWMTEEPVFTGDRFSTNTDSLFNVVPAHFAFVDTGVVYSNPHVLLTNIFKDFFHRLHNLYNEDNARLNDLRTHDVQEVNRALWIHSCCSEIIVSNSDQRIFATHQRKKERKARLANKTFFIPSRGFRLETMELIQHRFTPEYKLETVKLLSRMRSKIPKRVVNRELEDRAVAVNKEIEDETRKQKERVLGFIKWSTFPDDFRVRITCNVNSSTFISSVTQPPVPNSEDDSVKKAMSSSSSSSSSPSPSMFFCESCDYQTSRSNNYKRHISSVKHKKRTSTEEDNPEQSSGTNRILNTDDDDDDNPSETRGSSDNGISCRYCNMKFRDIHNYHRHILSRKHQQNVERVTYMKHNTIACGQCSSRFPDAEKYYDHLQTNHGQELRRSCHACECIHNQSDHGEHLKTREHIERTRYGPWQRYCEHCSMAFSTRSEMINHNESDEHLAQLPLFVDTNKPFKTIEVSLDRVLLAFASGHEFINSSLFVDTHVFNLIVNADDRLRNTSDYITLMLMTACIQPFYRNIYTTLDGLSGFVVCNIVGKIGVLGAYNIEHEGFVELLSRFIREEVLDEINFIEYAPVHLKDKILEALEKFYVEEITFSNYLIPGVPHGDLHYHIVKFV